MSLILVAFILVSLVSFSFDYQGIKSTVELPGHLYIIQFNPLHASVALSVALIYFANQLTGFYMKATLAFNGLNFIFSYFLSRAFFYENW